MSKLSRIIISVIFFAIGAGIIFFSGSALLHISDLITFAIYISVIIIGVAFMAIGWAIARGEDIKDMLRDLFSGISF